MDRFISFAERSWHEGLCGGLCFPSSHWECQSWLRAATSTACPQCCSGGFWSHRRKGSCSVLPCLGCSPLTPPCQGPPPPRFCPSPGCRSTRDLMGTCLSPLPDSFTPIYSVGGVTGFVPYWMKLEVGLYWEAGGRAAPRAPAVGSNPAPRGEPRSWAACRETLLCAQIHLVSKVDLNRCQHTS